MTKVRSGAQIVSLEQIAALREAGFVIVHREPRISMIKAFIADRYSEDWDVVAGWHRMVATSIKIQKGTLPDAA